MRRRLDAELVRRGLAESRSAARELVEAGRVRVGGAPAQKVTRQVDAAEPIALDGPPSRYVGRGAHKLDAALEQFRIDVAGAHALDAGASTGGFTDCLLQRGAEHVVALDVGHGQLHDRLRRDPRVEVMERVNVRHVDPDELGPFDIVVSDLSFISLSVVMGVLVGCCSPGAPLVVLVKPQFEAGREEVSRGRGVIRDPALWRAALDRVAESVVDAGAAIMEVMQSPIRGAEGNVEFLLYAQRTDQGATGDVAVGTPDAATVAASFDRVVAAAGADSETDGAT